MGWQNAILLPSSSNTVSDGGFPTKNTIILGFPRASDAVYGEVVI